LVGRAEVVLIIHERCAMQCRSTCDSPTPVQPPANTLPTPRPHPETTPPTPRQHPANTPPTLRQHPTNTPPTPRQHPANTPPTLDGSIKQRLPGSVARRRYREGTQVSTHGGGARHAAPAALAAHVRSNKNNSNTNSSRSRSRGEAPRETASHLSMFHVPRRRLSSHTGSSDWTSAVTSTCSGFGA
jgi:hypothetical protein